MLDWALAGAVGLSNIINSITQGVIADKNLKVNQKAQEDQMRLQQQQLDREIQAAEAQAQKEANTTKANTEAMGNVFGNNPKKKKQENMFINDVQGLF